ncbi:MAG: OmpA family protein [Methylotetracoccus sp.]
MVRNFLCALALTGLATSGVQAAEQGQDMTAAPEATASEAAPVAEGAAVEAAPVASDEWVDDRFYIAPFGTYMHSGGDRRAYDAWGGGMAIGKVLNQYFNVEIRGFWESYGNNNNGRYTNGRRGGHSDITGGTVDLQYHFMREANNPFSPYVVAALGGVNTSYRTSESTGWSGSSFLFQTGLGATYELADNFLLRGDVRYQLQAIDKKAYNNSNPLNDLVVNAGFVIPLGDKPQAVAAAAPAPVDDCSTRDSDGDGVNDCDDKCPGTMKGAKVDEYGCLVRIELRGVNFHYDSAQLTDTAMAILDEVSTGLIASDEKKDIEVAGHASSEGTDQYNMKLSQRRAASVVEYLKGKGVTNNLYPKGYGESYPIADNSTEEGRSKNRRVELVWMGD